MPLGQTTAVGGGALGILGLFASSTLREPPQPELKQLGEHLFVPWKLDDDSLLEQEVPEPECSWFDHSYKFESSFCSHFVLSRLASSAAPQALKRATLCAAERETDCVLSVEVGLSIPAAFVYDPATDGGLKMIVAPRLFAHESEEVDVRVVDVSGSNPSQILAFNKTIRTEYLPGASRVPVTAELSEHEAFCVQLLRAAYAPSCWESLD